MQASRTLPPFSSLRLRFSHKPESVILDPRVLTKNYGNAFLRALLKCQVEVV